MMILLYDSAIRLDELLSLTVKDLILENGSPCIKVNGKENKECRFLHPLDTEQSNCKHYFLSFPAAFIFSISSCMMNSVIEGQSLLSSYRASAFSSMSRNSKRPAILDISV